MSRANDELLDELHGLQARTLLEEIRRQAASGEGVNPSLLAQANKFLKDNGVDRAIKPGDPTDLLAEELPEFEDANIVQGKF